jgi:hypothetical protein
MIGEAPERELSSFWFSRLFWASRFFMIADIDSPRWGVIRVLPQNLLSLSQSLHGQ